MAATSEPVSVEVAEAPAELADNTPAGVHDVYILGIFTSAVADGWRGMCTSYPPEAMVKSEFEKYAKEDKIDKYDLAMALRGLGNSERQTQKFMDFVPVDKTEWDLEEFAALVGPPSYECVAPYNVTRPFNPTVPECPVPGPNYDKLWEIPVIGNVLSTIGNTISEPMDNYNRKDYRSRAPNDLQLKETFIECDVDKDGKLNKKELANALRVRGFWETEIRDICEGMEKDGVSCYEYKKLIRGPKYVPGSMHYIPVVGAPIHHYAVGDDEIPEEDAKEAWDHIAQGKATLTAAEVTQVLEELGKSEYQISILLGNGITEFNQFDFLALLVEHNYMEKKEDKVA